MTTHILRPEHLTAHELDAYLARGWFRIGPTLTTCRFLTLAGDLRSAIWLRYDLRRVEERATQRRRCNRVRNRFRVEVGPARIDEARENLYARYVEVAPGTRPADLQSFLFHTDERVLGEDTVWDTRELTVWDGDRLIALHLCDVGHEAVASLLGAFDPEYARFSLGYVTLLMEIAWAQEQGYRYHYPGYVVPGAGSMDYKLRIRPVDGFDMELGAWRPWSGFVDEDQPLVKLDGALERVAQRVAGDVRWISHPSFALLVELPNADAFVDVPRFLAVHETDDDLHLVVLYEPVGREYTVRWARRVEHPAVRLDGVETTVILWVKGPEVVTSSAPEVIAVAVRRLRRKR